MTLQERINNIRVDQDRSSDINSVEAQIDLIVQYLTEKADNEHDPHRVLNFCYCSEDWTDGTTLCQACGRKREF